MASRNQRRRNQKIANENIESLQKKNSNNPVMWVVSIVILVVIVVTFVGAPVAGKVSASRSNLVFGSYDGEDIIYSEGSYFSDQVYSIAERYRDQITDSNAYFIQYQVWRSAFDNTAYRTAVIKELKNSGVIISSSAVDEAIVLYGPYMENGEFSENLYKQSSNTEKKFVRTRFRNDLYFSRFAGDINSNPINHNEEDFLKSVAAVEKQFRYVAFPFSSFPDEKVVEYGTENSSLFRSIKISKITINSGKNEAEQILSKINDSPDLFSELAKTQSTDPYADKGGEMGSRFYYELKNTINNDEALDEVFNLMTGDFSNVIESDGKWVIYRCDRAPEYADLSNESDLSSVRDYMQTYAKGFIEDYLVAKADNFSDFAKNEGFETAAVDSSLNYHETNSFPVVYGSPSVYYYNQSIPIYTQPSVDGDNSLNGIMSNEYVLKAINKLAMNEISESLVLNDNVVVMQLTGETQKDKTELESVPSLITYASQNWLGAQLEEYIHQSDKFKDNFAQVFSNIFKNS